MAGKKWQSSVKNQGSNGMCWAFGAYAALEASLRALNPEAVLERGYAVVRQDNAIIGGAAQANPDAPIDVCFADGTLTARIDRIHPRNGET